jgi:hypothetical protein
MSDTLRRVTGMLLLVALTACTRTGGPPAPDPRLPGAALDTMTDPASGQAVIRGPVLTGTAPRSPGKSSGISSIGEPVSPATAVPGRSGRSETQQATGTDAAPGSSGRRLGTTIASLGDPSRPGYWIRTPLVDTESDGHIVNTGNGRSAAVRLIPLDGPVGGGSQVSLSALQLIGVSLTDLPAIEVFAG